jgi:hypothetical protein
LSATIEVVDQHERLLGAGRFTTDRAGGRGSFLHHSHPSTSCERPHDTEAGVVEVHDACATLAAGLAAWKLRFLGYLRGGKGGFFLCCTQRPEGAGVGGFAVVGSRNSMRQPPRTDRMRQRRPFSEAAL